MRSNVQTTVGKMKYYGQVDVISVLFRRRGPYDRLHSIDNAASTDFIFIAHSTLRLSQTDQSWTWIGSIHGLDWIGSDDCNPLYFFICIFSILTTDKRWRCNTIMSILADFNRLWLDCEFYKTLRLGSIALWHPLIWRLLKDRMLSVFVDRWVSVV